MDVLLNSVNFGLVWQIKGLAICGVMDSGLNPGPNNTVIGGYDKYDFDIKSWSAQTFVRNIETIIGRAYAGPGTAYDINFTGTANLGSNKGKGGN